MNKFSIFLQLRPRISFYFEYLLRYYKNLPLYIFPADNKSFDLGSICIESAFEHPTPIEVSNGTANNWDALNDDNEYLLSEDMIGQLKEIIYKRDLLQTVRQTDEISNNIKFNG